MSLAFEVRFKGCLRAPPLPAISPTCSGLRPQVYLGGWCSWRNRLVISRVFGTTEGWKSRKLKGRRPWVVSLNDRSNSDTFLRIGEEQLKMSQEFSQAAKQLGQAVVGSLLGLALLLSSPELGQACSSPSTVAGEVPGYSSSRDRQRNSQLEHYHHERISVALDSVGGFERVPKVTSDRGMSHLNYLLGKPANASRVRRWGSSHSGLRMFSSRREFVHEGTRDSLGVTYGQILQGRDDTAKRESMFTEDAWIGMTKLRQYDELLDKVEAEEKLCPECTKNRRLLEQVWQTVSNEYYDQYGSFSQSAWASKLYDSLSTTGGLLRTKKETYRVIKNMVDSLGDRYSAFLNPQQYRLAIRRPIPSEIKYLTYQYTGVGVALGKKSPSGGFTIVSPFAGSPAEEAGILPGERLLRVDGNPVDSLSEEEAVSLLRGPVGSSVELEVTGLQPGNSVRKISLERRALPLPPLRMRLVDAGDGRVLEYMRLHYFTHEGTKIMAAAIREGEALGVDGYILDLRNNPGGVFEEAIAMAALWLDCQGCDVTETVRSSVESTEDLVYSVNNLPKEIFLRHPGTLTHAPLAIITNRSSASASEVLTGALHDNHRAVVVGEKTFGKGVVQYFFPMDDGSGLKLTVEKYLTPARYDISKQGGLQPDRSCTDFPHQSGQSDSCIDEALEMLGEKQEQTANRPPTEQRLPYRWLPLTERSFLTGGTY